MQRRGRWRPAACALAGWTHSKLSAVVRGRGGGTGPLSAAGTQGMNTFQPARFPFITLLTLLPFAGAFAVLLLGKASRSAARLVAAIFATAAVAYTCMLWHLFQPAVQGMQLQEWHAWEPSIGLQYHVGLDGLSLVMLAVSSIAVLMSIAASWNNSKTRAGLFFSAALSGDGSIRHLYCA